mgnify:CR=1 FL=1
MPGRIPDTLIQQILDRVNLADLIGQQVKLKKAGRNYLGLCPFHSDSKPSFNVSPEKGFYYCFGCREGGNALSYMKKVRGMDYVESVETLAAMVGIEMEYEEGDGTAWRQKREKTRSLLALNKEANSLFRQTLMSAVGVEGRKYLSDRGIDRETASRFQVGFAPEGAGVYDHFAATGAPLNLAEELGLVIRSSRNGRWYDRLQSRIVFPVLTVADEIAGFSGRALPGGRDPKYLNSSESEIFRKGELLFGLVQGREAMKKRNFCLLVEGQLDVLALHQAGFANAVAPLGTALTDHQVAIMRRFTDSVYIMFDGDSAGLKAAWRAMSVVMGAGLYGKMVVLPDGEDPDSVLRSSGPEALEDAIAAATPYLEYAVESIVARAGTELHSRTVAAREGMEFAATIRDTLDRQGFLQHLAERMSLSPDSLRVEAARSLYDDSDDEGPAEEEEPVSPMERQLVEWVLLKPDLAKLMCQDDVFDLLRSAAVKELFSLIFEELEEHGVVDLESVSARISNTELRDMFARLILTGREVDEQTVHRGLADQLGHLRERRLTERSDRLAVKMREAQASGNAELALELLRQQDELDLELRRGLDGMDINLRL